MFPHEIPSRPGYVSLDSCQCYNSVRACDTYGGDYRFTLPLPCAPPMASPARKATFLAETASFTFAHSIGQKPPTELKH